MPKNLPTPHASANRSPYCTAYVANNYECPFQIRNRSHIATHLVLVHDWGYRFSRAMLCGYEIACRLSVRLSVRPSVCLSVTFRYRDHVGLNSSKIISRLNSLRPMRSLTPNMADLVQREHPKIRVE